MTNERYTTPTTTAPDDDGTTYIIAPLPLDDRECLRLMLQLQHDAAKNMLEIANYDLSTSEYNIDSDRPLTQFDYSGDHDDYNPNTADALAMVTNALCSHEHETRRDTLIALIETEDFCFAMTTSMISTPLADLITDPELD